jgi:hypothetical protein
MIIDPMVAQLAGRVDEDRWPAQGLEPAEVPVDALGFLLRVGEDRIVELLVELAVDEHQVQGG